MVCSPAIIHHHVKSGKEKTGISSCTKSSYLSPDQSEMLGLIIPEYGDIESNSNGEIVVGVNAGKPYHELCSSNKKTDHSFSTYFIKRCKVQPCGILSVSDICTVIPKQNKSGHVYSDFDIEIIHDVSYHPPTNVLQCLASPVIFMKPHGAKFFDSYPAEILLPIKAHLKPGDKVICFCSDTEIDEKMKWKPMSPEEFDVCGTYIKIRTTHFSFYTAVVNRGYPEASKMVYAGIGGTLEIPDVPGLEVIFPGSAIQYDIEATVKVMFADGPYDVDHDDPTTFALAAPVVKLGPTGHHFNPQSIEHVKVRLPLPNGKDILENCGRPFLTFWQSTSAEGQELEWKLFQTDYRIDVDDDGLYSVCFAVSHFTFFRVLWSILDSVVNEAKIGASFFYPNFQFYIGFQAFMSEDEGNKTFGLCCLCYRMGVPPESIGNYPIFLGSSGPRMVTSACLQIRVVSSIFEANADFGEEVLSQQEYFTGRPFDKQFACKYIVANVPTHGTIGKVHIEKKNNDGTVEPLFDFLLTKPHPGKEIPHMSRNVHQNGISNGNDTWEGELSKELARWCTLHPAPSKCIAAEHEMLFSPALLSIKTDRDLGDDVWQDVALALGYKPIEIDMKFKGEADPLMKLLNDYKSRRGSPREFISAMYAVGRKEKVSEYERRIRNTFPDVTEEERDLEDDIIGQNGSASPSRTSSSSGVVLPSMPVNSRKRRHTDGNNGPVPEAKLSEVAAGVQNHWKKLGRALELEEDQIREIDKDYKNDGIQEQAYQMLLAWKESYPENGYDTLFRALSKLHLNGIARQLYFNP